MKHAVLATIIAVTSLQLSAAPVRAEMSDAEKGAAALAILGIAALAHHNRHYNGGYSPGDGQQTAEFERGYRDAKFGHAYDERHGTRHYAEGYQAGMAERESSSTYRRPGALGETPPPMAIQGCAQIVAQNFAVATHQVHMVHARSPQNHRWEIETRVGHDHMVCTMRDSGEVIEVRGGRL